MSASAQLRTVELAVRRQLAGVDSAELPREERAAIESLQRLLADCRLDVRDYEYSETRDEQLANAAVAKKHITQLQQLVLRASSYGVFGPADVAHVSASLEQIAEQLD